MIKTATASDHRRRLGNIAICERGIRRCMRKYFITGYMPGQCVYNLGEYPCHRPWETDGWDEGQLADLSASGVELVQVHEEWNDSQRLFGADKLSPLNAQGFRRFIDGCHRNGLEIIPYISTGYFERTDPDFRPEWARDTRASVHQYYRYARCSPASASWRAYLLPRLWRILDEYGVDGFYNDAGYSPLCALSEPKTDDEVEAFEESETHHGAFVDLLGLIYGEVRRRGGIVKLHAGVYYRGALRPPTEPKLYDYLWTGENQVDPDSQREALKGHPPFLVPCIDLARTPVEREDDLYLHSIPYMQFPVLLAGRPFTGERAMIPGIDYKPEPEDPNVWTRSRHCKRIWEHYQAHPEGPYSYGWWDSCPDRSEARPTYYRWLKHYRPMVEDGTWAYLEIGDADLFVRPLPEGVVASAFANRDLYLVLANYSRQPVEIATADAYVPVLDGSAVSGKYWNLQGRSLHILRKEEGESPRSAG